MSAGEFWLLAKSPIRSLSAFRETVTGMGYRFVAPTTVIEPPVTAAPEPSPLPDHGVERTYVRLGAFRAGLSGADQEDGSAAGVVIGLISGCQRHRVCHISRGDLVACKPGWHKTGPVDQPTNQQAPMTSAGSARSLEVHSKASCSLAK